METSQTIYLPSTSKTIMARIENDNGNKKTTLAECMCASVWSRGGMERKIEFFCSSCALLASVVLNLYMDKRKKNTYQYERENNR